MAHKTKVNGTNYEISGGKTLVNGTAYKIKNGKTLVGGAAYEVGFGEYVPLYDFGTIEAKTDVIGGYIVTQYMVDLSFDFDEPTHMMVNGEIFEVVYSGGSNRHDYNIAGMTSIFVSAEYPYKIFFPQNASGSGWNASFTAFSAGTYTVSLGKYA